MPDESALDSWDLRSGTAIDVIVFGDTSGSMDEELRTLGQTVTPFAERLAETVDDWQLASINGDDGCTQTGILTPDTPNFADRFADALTQSPWDEDTDEQGLSTAARAVRESRPGGCNEGLVRGELLHLIFVSDENDESPGFDESPSYWRDYWTQIVEQHGDELMVTMSAVAGPTPGGCTGADPGFGYDGAVAGTSGEFLSLCDDWAADIDLLADAGVVRDTFPLSERPVATTIEVWINAVGVGGDRWRYDAGANAVVFDADPPVGGDQVDILYTVAL